MTAPRLLSAYRAGGPDGRPGWRLAVAFDHEFIEELKRAIPAQDRAWLPAEQCWFVALEHEAELLRLVPAFAAYQRQGQLL